MSETATTTTIEYCPDTCCLALCSAYSPGPGIQPSVMPIFRRSSDTSRPNLICYWLSPYTRPIVNLYNLFLIYSYSSNILLSTGEFKIYANSQNFSYFYYSRYEYEFNVIATQYCSTFHFIKTKLEWIYSSLRATCVHKTGENIHWTQKQTELFVRPGKAPILCRLFAHVNVTCKAIELFKPYSNLFRTQNLHITTLSQQTTNDF